MKTLKDIKMQTLALIEELNPDSVLLTDDPDIQAKLHYVINQVMFELARMKKIPMYLEMDVSEGDLVDFAMIRKKCGKEVYQLDKISGATHVFKANGTIVKFLEEGTAEIDFFVYPTAINAETTDAYEFELSQDCLEILPYGVAADLLKSDVSAEYGSVYATRYENMLQRLDPRNHLTSVVLEGGW